MTRSTSRELRRGIAQGDLDRLPFAIVSTAIRRDQHEPMRHFRRLEPMHFYNVAPYGDMTESELDSAQCCRYSNPIGLFWRLWRSHARIVQGVEPFYLRQLPYAFATAIYAKLAHVPLVIASLENIPLAQKYPRTVSMVARRLIATYLRGASLVIAVNSGAEENLLAMSVPTGRLVRALYGSWGVDIDEYCASGPAERLPGKPPWTLFIGRLDEAKGILDLIDAFSLIPIDIRGTLVIAGGGPARAIAEARAERLGRQGAVHFLGSVPNTRVPNLLRGATVVASPSRPTRKWAEQVGMVNLQALACSVPVVSTTSGSIPEFLKDGITALLVPPGSPAALAGALRRMFGDPQLRDRLGQAGRAAVLERYDARSNIENIENRILALLEPTA